MNKNKRDYHHQLSNVCSHNLTENIKKRSATLCYFNVSFESRDDYIMNVATKAILPEEAEKDVMDQKHEGERLYNNYTDECIIGEKSTWDRMKKRKLKLFSLLAKKNKMALKDRVVQLKEEKNLMARFVITSRIRQDINLPELFGQYQFTIVPRAMFSIDGRLLNCTECIALRTL